MESRRAPELYRIVDTMPGDEGLAGQFYDTNRAPIEAPLASRRHLAFHAMWRDDDDRQGVEAMLLGDGPYEREIVFRREAFIDERS